MRISCPSKYAVGLQFADSSVAWTIAKMSALVWTSSTSVQIFCAIIHSNSEYMAKADQRLRLCNIRKRQRIGQPYMRNPGRCFVAIVDIEADSLTSCSNRGGRSPTKGNGGKTVHCPTPFWSGRRAGNKQSPDPPTFFHYLFVLADWRLT